MSEDDDVQTARDIAALQAYRQYRIDFISGVVGAAEVKTADVTGVLRTDPTFQLAEFYYLLAGFGIRSTEHFNQLIERHNSYISELLDDKAKMERMGLSQERLLNSIFDGETRPRVLKIWSDEPGVVDQTSLGRLLVAVMSDETTRKTIVACAKAGFLTRQNSVYRVTLVKSTGILERIYGECLRRVRRRIEQLS